MFSVLQRSRWCKGFQPVSPSSPLSLVQMLVIVSSSSLVFSLTSSHVSANVQLGHQSHSSAFLTCSISFFLSPKSLTMVLALTTLSLCSMSHSLTMDLALTTLHLCSMSHSLTMDLVLTTLRLCSMSHSLTMDLVLTTLSLCSMSHSLTMDLALTTLRLCSMSHSLTMDLALSYTLFVFHESLTDYGSRPQYTSFVFHESLTDYGSGPHYTLFVFHECSMAWLMSRFKYSSVWVSFLNTLVWIVLSVNYWPGIPPLSFPCLRLGFLVALPLPLSTSCHHEINRVQVFHECLGLVFLQDSVCLCWG